MSTSIQKLTDEALLIQTTEMAKVERETTTAILHLLREIERRKLFSSLKCSSLFDYCVRILGYSEPSAQRRIASMRMLTELPDIEERIREGSLSLSFVAQAQTFFRNEAKVNHGLAPDAKREVLQALEGKSSREAERELLKRSSNPMSPPSEQVRVVSETHTQLKLTVPEHTMKDLQRLRGFLAHSHPNLSLSELVALLAKMGLEKLDPARKPKREQKPKPEQLPTQKPTLPVTLRRSRLWGWLRWSGNKGNLLAPRRRHNAHTRLNLRQIQTG